MSAVSLTTPMTGRFGVVLTADSSNRTLDSLSAQEIRGLYVDHGVVLLRGFRGDTTLFDAFVSQFIAESIVNGTVAREDIAPDARIQTVNSGTQAIALHAEMAYSPLRPDLLCFYCLQPPPPMSGETLLCDGVELWDKVSPPLRAMFDGAQIRYTFSRNRMLAIQAASHQHRLREDSRVKHFQAHDDGTVDLEFVVPAVQKIRHGDARAFANSVIVEPDSASLEGGGPIEERVRCELLLTSTALSHRIAWEKDDILIVDNSRFMHGRRKLMPDGGRKIALKMGWERQRAPHE